MRTRAASIHQRGLGRQQGFCRQRIDGQIRELQGAPRFRHGTGAQIEWI
jgi:hypothetical protein